jgi:hypothetical protein
MMLLIAFYDCDVGISVRYQTDGTVFNLQRLQSRTKTQSSLVWDLLYDDDCALLALLRKLSICLTGSTQQQSSWRVMCKTAVTNFESNHTDMAWEKPARRKAGTYTSTAAVFYCSVCERARGSRIGLCSHQRTHNL